MTFISRVMTTLSVGSTKHRLEQQLWVLKNKAVRILGPKNDKINRVTEKYTATFHNLYFSLICTDWYERRETEMHSKLDGETSW
jgi:hypothetical protein